MNKAAERIIELSDLFAIKYAAKSKDLKCTCEQAVCREMGSHNPSNCKNESSGKGSMYLGPICDECAMFLDKQYLIDLD